MLRSVFPLLRLGRYDGFRGVGDIDKDQLESDDDDPSHNLEVKKLTAVAKKYRGSIAIFSQYLWFGKR